VRDRSTTPEVLVVETQPVDQPKILDATPDHALGYAPGVVLYIWRGPTTVAATEILREAMGAVRHGSEGTPKLLLGVVEAGTPPPETVVRKALAEVLGLGNDFICASALAFEGQGFQASMVRAVATGLSLLARTTYPHQVFREVESASEWLAERSDAVSPGAHTPEALRARLAALRSAPHT
jgi:hypothetical protein